MAHIDKTKDALLGRVKRIAGQIGAVERALGSDADCTQVLHLVAAVRGCDPRQQAILRLEQDDMLPGLDRRGGHLQGDGCPNPPPGATAHRP